MSTTISPKTSIKELLETNREPVIDQLTSLNQNFSKLRNPLLRNVFAKRVTIAQACKIAGCAVSDFMESMKRIGFMIDDQQNIKEQAELPVYSPVEADCYLELDVRPILAQGKDPLKEIMAAIKKLEENQGLKLINTFEPLPLSQLLADKGFAHRVEFANDIVITYFTKPASGVKENLSFSAAEAAADETQFDSWLKAIPPEKIRYLDVRQLEMPKPMLAILEQTPHLLAGDALFVYHKKIPVYLLPELEKQGLKYVFKNLSPGNVNLLIRKP